MKLSENNLATGNLFALVDFSNTINSNLNLTFTLNNLLLTCLGKLQTTKGLITLYNSDGKLEVSLSKGIKKDLKESFPKIFESDSNKHKILQEFLIEHNFSIFEKFVSSEKELGSIFLGKKINDLEFTQEDLSFFSTIIKIASTTIANSINFEKLQNVNKILDSKINQLNSLFDLGKEFSSILDINRVSKLLVYSISAQMLVSKYAIILVNNNQPKILESKFSNMNLLEILNSCKCENINKPIHTSENEKFKDFKNLGIHLIVPMILKNITKGVILLGKRINNLEYSKSDVEYLYSVGSLAIISIENANLFLETIEKQKLEKDLEIARNIQQNLMPKQIPQSERYEITTVNKTAKMVGGDYFDVVLLESKNLLLAIADVSGKGIQASLLMANLQAFLKSLYKQNYQLSEASNFLNDLVSENTTNGSFITFFWGKLDEGNKFTYVNMGHNPPLLIRNGEIIKLTKGGMILGVMKTLIPYEFETVQLYKDDVLILFTDGITEAMNNDNEEYGDERLENLMLKNANNESRKILENLLDDLSSHTSGAEQSDDITAIVMKMK